MKLLIVIQCANLGGMEHNARLLIEECQRRGIGVELVSLNPLGGLEPLLAEMGVQAVGLNYRGKWGWRTLPALRSRLKSAAADGVLMVGHNLMAMAALDGVCRDHRVLSVHFHHQGVKPEWQWRWIYQIARRRFTSIVFVSEYILNEAIAIAPFLRQKSLLISTPVQPRKAVDAASRSAARAKFGLPPEAKLVGNAGWLTPRKRWDVFFDCAARIARSIPSARFLIAGNGPLEADLRARAQSLGIAEKVSWLGWQQDLEPFYHCLDVLLFHSDADAQARTPLEAMSYGIPVVASVLAGGTGEVICHPDLGTLMPAHDVEKLSKSVVRLLHYPDLAHAMGARGRQKVIEYGSPSLHADRVLGALRFPTNDLPA